MRKRSAEEAAARKLADRSMSVEELRRWLRNKGYSADETETVIAVFLELDYLNDERYCSEYIDYALRRNMGRRRILADLAGRGINGEMAENAYEDFVSEEDVPPEAERAREEASRVLRMADLTWDDPVPEKIRARVARKLNSYGFSASTIYGILDEMKRG